MPGWWHRHNAGRDRRQAECASNGVPGQCIADRPACSAVQFESQHNRLFYLARMHQRSRQSSPVVADDLLTAETRHVVKALAGIHLRIWKATGGRWVEREGCKQLHMHVRQSGRHRSNGVGQPGRRCGAGTSATGTSALHVPLRTSGQSGRVASATTKVWRSCKGGQGCRGSKRVGGSGTMHRSGGGRAGTREVEWECSRALLAPCRSPSQVPRGT